MSVFKISEQANVIDDNLLNIFGNQFKFDHAKGLAEWIKNSVDAYNRDQRADEDQFIYVRLQPRSPVNPARFDCIDFVGMTHDEIERAFKRWGDPNAASRGKGKKFLGGHGNGGKFYMRQMFGESRFITYRDGKLNVFGFNSQKKYGFDPSYENRRLGLKRALELADLNDLLPHLPKIVRSRLEKGETGFTVVTGEAPHKIQRRNAPKSIIQRLCVHPQARRLIQRKQVFAVVAGQPIFKLVADKIVPRVGFEGPFEYPIPNIVQHGGQDVELGNEKFPAAKLTLFTSAEPFSRLGDRAALNCIDILGEVGVIASYRMNELGQVKNYSEAEFIFGECYCPILEDAKDDCTNNDREKLVENEKTFALLEWICQKVNELADKMAAKSTENQKVEELRQSSFFNEFLNSWMRKSKFWEKLRGEIFGGPDAGEGFGGIGGGGEAAGKDGEGSGKDGKAGDNGELGGGAGDKKKQGPKFPDVRLSDCDPDPLGLGESVHCDPRHPLVYQRGEDFPQGIYWINTQSPFAKKVRDNYGHESPRWREYMFQRHLDIMIKQAVYEMERREPQLSAARLDNEVFDLVTRRVYEAAAEDTSLASFLFTEKLSGVENSGDFVSPSTETPPSGS